MPALSFGIQPCRRRRSAQITKCSTLKHHPVLHALTVTAAVLCLSKQRFTQTLPIVMIIGAPSQKFAWSTLELQDPDDDGFIDLVKRKAGSCVTVLFCSVCVV